MKELLICTCSSLEHQMLFWYDKETRLFAIEVHLCTHRGFFKRLWIGLKYAFGYKCMYGNWDEFLFDKDEVKKLYDFLKNFIET